MNTIRAPRRGTRAMVATLATLVPGAACAQNAESGRVARVDATVVETERMLPSLGIRAVPGVLAGHFTLSERPTGCTVILVPDGVVGAVDVRGGAPGSRETDLLDPVNSIQEVHGILLSGGSAFGLAAADGVSRFLEERGRGFRAGSAIVPIVPAAILFDLGVGDPTIRPDAECGYRAAQAALDAATPLAEGNAGAGAGATVGKVAGMERAMKGGIGTASTRLSSGLVVAAIIAVNPVGDVVDPATGRVIAGVRSEQGDELADARRVLRTRAPPSSTPAPSNTVIGVVATNAALSQAEATKVAQMAHDGIARAIAPAHTPWDGDTLFSLATGELTEGYDLTTIGSLAADVVAEAIVRAVLAAESIDGFPAARDLPDYGGDTTP